MALCTGMRRGEMFKIDLGSDIVYCNCRPLTIIQFITHTASPEAPLMKNDVLDFQLRNCACKTMPTAVPTSSHFS